MDDIKLPDILGWIVKYTVAAAAMMAGLFVVSIIARPVIEELSSLMSQMQSSFSSGTRDIHSLGMACILLIGLIGLAKVLKKK